MAERGHSRSRSPLRQTQEAEVAKEAGTWGSQEDGSVERGGDPPAESTARSKQDDSWWSKNDSAEGGRARSRSRDQDRSTATSSDTWARKSWNSRDNGMMEKVDSKMQEIMESKRSSRWNSGDRGQQDEGGGGQWGRKWDWQKGNDQSGSGARWRSWGEDSGWSRHNGGASGETYTGTLVTYVSEKGFGFIRPDDGDGKDLFFNRREVVRDSQHMIREGLRVSYSIQDRRGKPGTKEACRVSVAAGFDPSKVGATKGIVVEFNEQKNVGYLKPKAAELGDMKVIFRGQNIVDGSVPQINAVLRFDMLVYGETSKNPGDKYAVNISTPVAKPPVKLPQEVMEWKLRIQQSQEEMQLTLSSSEARAKLEAKLQQMTAVYREMLEDFGIDDSDDDEAMPAAKPAEQGNTGEETRLVLTGFFRPELNSEYKSQAAVQVNGRETFWSLDESIFMYWDCSDVPRWQLSPRFDGIFDLLADVRQGKSVGLAYEVDVDQGIWAESLDDGSFYEHPVISEVISAPGQTLDALPDSVEEHTWPGEPMSFDSLAYQGLMDELGQSEVPAEREEQQLVDVPAVPAFSENAAGSSLLWNSEEDYKDGEIFYWGKRWRAKFEAQQPEKTAEVDINKMIHFFSIRPDAHGRAISEKIGEPEPKDYGWFRFPWKEFDEASLPASSEGEWAAHWQDGKGQADWQRAWHGCKIEGLYSIMYHGKLFASHDVKDGHRMIGNVPGVYVHKDGTAGKCGSYERFVPVFSDGIWWAARWELRVDRSDRVPVGSRLGTDQWVQQERSVRLAALWLCGRRYTDMEEGDEVAKRWRAELEANPMRESKSAPFIRPEDIQLGDNPDNAIDEQAGPEKEEHVSAEMAVQSAVAKAPAPSAFMAVQSAVAKAPPPSAEMTEQSAAPPAPAPSVAKAMASAVAKAPPAPAPSAEMAEQSAVAKAPPAPAPSAETAEQSAVAKASAPSAGISIQSAMDKAMSFARSIMGKEPAPSADTAVESAVAKASEPAPSD